MGDRVILVNFWSSMFGARVKIALKEKGVSYEEKMEHLPNKTLLLLEMNPVHKRVPVLIHNGKPICGSLIIIEYIDQVWNDRASFFPEDPFARTQARFWADFVDRKLYDNCRRIVWHQSKEEAEKAKDETIENLRALEGALGDEPYFGGDVFGFVDIALIGFYSWFQTYEAFGDFSIEAECPKIIAWAKRCLERDTVSTSLAGDPNKVYGLAMSVRKTFGLDG
ncbi:Glutathione S-transferase U1 [Castilleja foliolosa]|uniref:glutathione transferase n=1 Tax=Castilleja foliolosa TaxID=1961234 RepID=A0ABD3CUJ5_9LAMI